MALDMISLQYLLPPKDLYPFFFVAVFFKNVIGLWTRFRKGIGPLKIVDENQKHSVGNWNWPRPISGRHAAVVLGTGLDWYNRKERDHHHHHHHNKTGRETHSKSIANDQWSELDRNQTAVRCSDPVAGRPIASTCSHPNTNTTNNSADLDFFSFFLL